MQISCVSCQFMFELDNNLVKPTGRLVRCPECDFIFMVQRQSFAEEPIAKDTNIDQSILNDLYSIRPKPYAELPVDRLFEESDDYEVQSLTAIEDFGETAQTESESNSNDFGLSDLPDLSEYEDMIDMNENTNSEKSSSANRKYNNRTENGKPDINE